MEKSPLQEYLKFAHEDATFDLITDVEQAIRVGDSVTASMKLGELRSVLWTLHVYIQELEPARTQTEPSAEERNLEF